MLNFDTFQAAFKVGCPNALLGGVKTRLSAAPVKRDGEIFLPLEALPAGAAAAKTEEIGGVTFAPLSAITGVYAKTDEMGLVILDENKEILAISRESNMNDMLLLMGKFMFDIEKVPMNREYAPATEEEKAGFTRVGKDALAKLLAHSPKHPLLFANDALFAKLRTIWQTKSDERICNQLMPLIARADKIFEGEIYQLNEDGSDLLNPVVNTYGTEDGYDAGGRHGQSSAHASNALTMAFACKITGDLKYAKPAYFIARDLGKWKHWGPGHFLCCAGTIDSLAVVYDWLYNEWKELGLDTDVIRRGIYEKGILAGYESFINDRSDFPSARQGTGWRFKLKADNWNAVCNAALIIGNLALLRDGVNGPITEEMYNKMITLLGGNLSSIMQDGLVIHQYAPDGSYVESNSYWAYGTNTLFSAIGALYDALGTDFGMHCSYGLDKTCYYALNTESAEFVGWNYHDGHLSAQGTSMFNLFATVSGDHNLYAFRADHIARGKSVSMYDVLYDPIIRGNEIPKTNAMPLDYHMQGIDGFVIRNGWTPGSLYAGIMGGYNPKGAHHNHIDSGAFMYHNAGKLWITDLGSDNYVIRGGGYFSNNALYRRNAEGHNVINLTSLPHGQVLDSKGIMTKVHSGDDCSYAVIDNLDVYREVNPKKVLRAMILTNNRRTTAIADELEFSAPETAYWFAHFNADKIEAVISEDRRTCVMKQDGEEITIRLITDTPTDGFEILDCEHYVLSSTANFEGEHPRKEFRRLAVKFENVTSLKCDVVISLSADADLPYAPAALETL